MGAVTSYTDDKANIICDRVANGEFLAVICREEGMPALRTVYDWKDADPSFAARLARAREIGQEYIEGDILMIADTPVVGAEVTDFPDGKQQVKRSDALGHRKLQIETRLKMLAIWNPKKYAAAKYGDAASEDGNRVPVYNSPSADDEE